MGSEKPSLQQLDVIQAETLFMKFLVEHNIALSAADHAGQLFRHMFPGSRIAKEYFCARMKATEIMKCCANNIILWVVQTGPFIVGIDGSQEGGEKCSTMVVRYLISNG